MNLTLSQITLTDVQGYSEEVQRYIFRNITPQQRYDLWKEKLDEILELEWNPEQMQLIQQVVNVFSVDIFIETGNQSKALRNNFAEEWTKKAVNAFPNGQLRDLFGTIISLKKEKIGDKPTDNQLIASMLLTRPKIANAQPDCNCRWGWWCSHACSESSCNGYSVGYGCGFMLIQSCDLVC